MNAIEKAEAAGVLSFWGEALRDAWGRDHMPSGWRIALVRPLERGPLGWEWAVRPLTGEERRGVVVVDGAFAVAALLDARQRAMDLADEALTAILVEAEEWAAAVAEVEGAPAAAGPWAEDPRREGWWERLGPERRVAQVYRDRGVGSWHWWAVGAKGMESGYALTREAGQAAADRVLEGR